MRQKTSLNRSILDQAWGLFRAQLEYKLEWNGSILLVVPPHNISRTYQCCGFVSKDNRKIQAEFECIDCRYKNHADVVGAMNVVEWGYRLLACGDATVLSRSIKQESTEARQILLAFHIANKFSLKKKCPLINLNFDNSFLEKYSFS
jgi:putative transposase